MTVDRTPEDVLAGVLRVSIAGQERLVPTLTIAETREWQATLGRGPEGFTIPVNDADWTAALVSRFSGLTLDTILDMVTSYDHTSVLGGRAYLETKADPDQLYQAAMLMVGVAFPFVGNLPLFLAALVLQPRSTRPSSTSGPSAPGDSTPEPSSELLTPVS